MGLIARLVQVLTGLLNNQATRLWMAKVFLKSLLVIIVPYAVFLSFNMIFREFVSWQVEQMNAMQVGIGGTAIQLSGMAAYLYHELGLGIGISMLVSTYCLLIAAKSIPGLR